VIVVDTNVIAALWLPTEWSARSERLLELDPDWIAPPLWRSEFRNVLATQVRAARLDLATGLEALEAAESLLGAREQAADSPTVLRLAVESRCSAYDCEFVALAQLLGVALVTLDRQVLTAFPSVAIHLDSLPLAEAPS
jgi:predicted nucleic acid-binding protein